MFRRGNYTIKIKLNHLLFYNAEGSFTQPYSKLSTHFYTLSIIYYNV